MSPCSACISLRHSETSTNTYTRPCRYPDIDSGSLTVHDHRERINYNGLPADSTSGIEFLRLGKVAERAYCVDCHTPLGVRHKHEPDITGITLGSVDVATIRDATVKEALRPGKQIFTSHRAWWCEGIGADSLPQFERFTGNFEEGLKAFEAGDP